MTVSRNRLCRLAMSSAAALLLSAAQSHVQSDMVPCSAFARNANGGWRVLSPVMLDLGGRLYSPTVGTVFPAESAQNGIEMSDVLDQQCANR